MTLLFSVRYTVTTMNTLNTLKRSRDDQEEADTILISNKKQKVEEEKQDVVVTVQQQKTETFSFDELHDRFPSGLVDILLHPDVRFSYSAPESLVGPETRTVCLPVLDIEKLDISEGGRTGYIDYVKPNDMPYPVMTGTERGRRFFAFKIRFLPNEIMRKSPRMRCDKEFPPLSEGTFVVVIFRRYSDDENRSWVYGTHRKHLHGDEEGCMGFGTYTLYDTMGEPDKFPNLEKVIQGRNEFYMLETNTDSD